MRMIELPVPLQAISICLLMLPLTACREDNVRSVVNSPPEVTVSVPHKKEVIEWDEYIGRFQAVERVEVRARVSGYVNEIRLKDGRMIEKGETLFVIDQRPFQIALERAQARFELARKRYTRVEALRKSRAISQEDFDSSLYEFLVAKANLDQAKLEMEFTEVKAQNEVLGEIVTKLTRVALSKTSS